MPGFSPSEIAELVSRLGLVNPEGPTTDEEGNVTVVAPTAIGGAAATTLITPERSELLAGQCKNCHGPFTVGIEVQCPPPHADADPIKVCASCLVTLFKTGQTFRMGWI